MLPVLIVCRADKLKEEVYLHGQPTLAVLQVHHFLKFVCPVSNESEQHGRVEGAD